MNWIAVYTALAYLFGIGSIPLWITYSDNQFNAKEMPLWIPITVTIMGSVFICLSVGLGVKK